MMKYTILFLIVLMNINIVFASGVEIGNGGNGIILKIFTAQYFTKKILERKDSKSLDILSKKYRKRFIKDIDNLFNTSNSIDTKLVFSMKNRLYISHNEEEVEVSAKTGHSIYSPIKFNIPKIIEEKLELVELTTLILHEIGHHFGLSVSMVDEDTNIYSKDVALELIINEVEIQNNVFKAIGVERTALKHALKKLKEIGNTSIRLGLEDSCNLIGTYNGTDQNGEACQIKINECGKTDNFHWIYDEDLEMDIPIEKETKFISLELSYDLSNDDFIFFLNNEAGHKHINIDSMGRFKEEVSVTKWSQDLPTEIIYQYSSGNRFWTNSCNLEN